MSDYDIDDMSELSLIQGSDREARMEKMLEIIIEKLEQIEKQMIRELQGKMK